MSGAPDHRAPKQKRQTAHSPRLPAPSVETTDLDGRVPAHERVPHAPIASRPRAEPRLADHLRGRFVEPLNLPRKEHDDRDGDGYATEFIRAHMLPGEAKTCSPPRPAMSGTTGRITRDTAPEGVGPQPMRDRVQVTHGSGIWHVTLDGAFRGDHEEEAHARATAAILKMSLK
jgi:hypothetical protein